MSTDELLAVKDFTHEVKRAVDVMDRFAGLLERVVALVEKAAAEEMASRARGGG